jgi:hypothetical protein
VWYIGVKKDKSFHANVITDCRGLDKINEGGKVFTNFVIWVAITISKNITRIPWLTCFTNKIVM